MTQALRPIALLVIASLTVAPAQAQFGGVLRKVSPPAASPSDGADNGGCPKGKKGSRTGRNILGGVIGGALSGVAGKTGFGSFLPTAEVAGTLTDAIACRLEPAEQLQAANATETVVTREAVGATASWSSETRPGVSGTSTIVARNDVAGGTKCMNLTDVVIVDGEETRVSKRMCKGPGDSRYAIVQV